MKELTSVIGRRKCITGVLVSIASPQLAEALVISGVDWLFFDMEHSVLDLRDVQQMVQTVSGRCLTFIRIEEPLPVYVKRALDVGCSGIIVPQVNDRATAELVASAGKYPPEGTRSVGLGRALGYGSTLSSGIVSENARSSIVVQIEHRDAVAVVDEILAVEGVDGVFVGPYDLSGSYGVPGDVGSEPVQAGIESVVQAAKKFNKPAGIFVGSAEMAKAEFERGFGFVAVGSDLAHLMSKVGDVVKKSRPI